MVFEANKYSANRRLLSKQLDHYTEKIARFISSQGLVMLLGKAWLYTYSGSSHTHSTQLGTGGEGLTVYQAHYDISTDLIYDQYKFML